MLPLSKTPEFSNTPEFFEFPCFLRSYKKIEHTNRFVMVTLPTRSGLKSSVGHFHHELCPGKVQKLVDTKPRRNTGKLWKWHFPICYGGSEHADRRRMVKFTCRSRDSMLIFLNGWIPEKLSSFEHPKRAHFFVHFAHKKWKNGRFVTKMGHYLTLWRSVSPLERLQVKIWKHMWM